MAKHQKKPLIVEAEQFLVWKQPWPKGVKQRVVSGSPHSIGGAEVEWYVVTIHGQETRVVNEDWIITEPDGIHHYPCKSDIFEKTYQPVVETEMVQFEGMWIPEVANLPALPYPCVTCMKFPCICPLEKSGGSEI